MRARLSSFQQLYRDLQPKTREDLYEENEVDEEKGDVSDSVKRSYSDSEALATQGASERASALLLTADRIDDTGNEEE